MQKVGFFYQLGFLNNNSENTDRLKKESHETVVFIKILFISICKL